MIYLGLWAGVPLPRILARGKRVWILEATGMTGMLYLVVLKRHVEEHDAKLC